MYMHVTDMYFRKELWNEKVQFETQFIRIPRPVPISIHFLCCNTFFKIIPLVFKGQITKECEGRKYLYECKPFMGRPL